ncbi:MAG: [FeFe] hydrogenase H-cluster radical SAM maturase HydG [Candidatus Brocadiaceae bacterium]|nr:[FeFe] hydrogenase H-cluster radical SAM maturase HydG [Candidatus Brocadiaceae bacterium]
MPALPTMTLSPGAVDFIDDARIETLLRGGEPDPAQVRDILARSLSKQDLDPAEAAVLLRVRSPELVEELFEGARNLKQEIYGNRIVLFAPLYIGNKCVNDCLYCGFRRSNPEAIRRTLSQNEIRAQVEALVNKGQKRLILVWGEHPDYDAAFMAQCVRTVYDTRVGRGEIRRVNINAAPLDDDGYRVMKEAGIGTYQVFQETYHHATYAALHPPHTRKGDYLWRQDALSRAFEAGLDDMGIGALFGLYDWRFEVLGLVSHARYLQDRYGVGPHTISFPRLRPASGLVSESAHIVSDADFQRLVAILRLAVPYTGLILTAREQPALRRKVMPFGVSQIDAGSRIEIGGYTEVGDAQVMEREQFSLGDIRSLDEIMRELLEDGYIPSFCTACYRIGRTGEDFMGHARPGHIKYCCEPNALSTLSEYLADYAQPETRAVGERLVARTLQEMAEKQRRIAADLVERVNGGERDVYV